MDINAFFLEKQNKTKLFYSIARKRQSVSELWVLESAATHVHGWIQNSFILCSPCYKINSTREKIRRLSERHTLPALEFKSNVPVDATTFKKSGNSRNPKPQKSTCMIVHVQRRAAACIPVVILYSSGHSGLSASGPPATSNFTILGSSVNVLWPVKYNAGTWALRGFPGKHAYCREGWAAPTVNCDGLHCKTVHQLSPIGAGSVRQGKLVLQATPVMLCAVVPRVLRVSTLDDLM